MFKLVIEATKRDLPEKRLVYKPEKEDKSGREAEDVQRKRELSRMNKVKFLNSWGSHAWSSILGLSVKEQYHRYTPLDDSILSWMKDTSQSFNESLSYRKVKPVNIRFIISMESRLSPEIRDDIILIQQYYVDGVATRHAEIRHCLQTNVRNEAITKIILLNERIYSDEELGVSSDKIEQVVIGKRLSYKSVFDYVSSKNIRGYIVLSNSDIFFDGSIANVMHSGLATSRKMFCQLRFEYNHGLELKKCRLHGPVSGCQDTWIWHSNMETTKAQRKILDISIGTWGCDNRVAYIFSLLGFVCHNEPYLIKTYHYHESNVRNYDNTEKIVGMVRHIFPVFNEENTFDNHHTFDVARENDNLRQYVAKKLLYGDPFIIPRIAGHENEVAMKGIVLLRDGKNDALLFTILSKNLVHGMFPTMKNNAGIKLSAPTSVYKYSKMYMSAFYKCEKYFWWEPWGGVGASHFTSQDFVVSNFQKTQVRRIGT